MVDSLRRDEVRQLMTQGAQLVEVLPAAEYDDEHLPGAINIPLKTLGPKTVAGLDRSNPVMTNRARWPTRCHRSGPPGVSALGCSVSAGSSAFRYGGGSC